MAGTPKRKKSEEKNEHDSAAKRNKVLEGRKAASDSGCRKTCEKFERCSREFGNWTGASDPTAPTAQTPEWSDDGMTATDDDRSWSMGMTLLLPTMARMKYLAEQRGNGSEADPNRSDTRNKAEQSAICGAINCSNGNKIWHPPCPFERRTHSCCGR